MADQDSSNKAVLELTPPFKYEEALFLQIRGYRELRAQVDAEHDALMDRVEKFLLEQAKKGKGRLEPIEDGDEPASWEDEDR